MFKAAYGLRLQAMLALAIASACGALGYRWGPLLATRPGIHIEPRLVELPRGVFQGEPISLFYQLVNDSADVIRINDLSASCGCMAILGREGSPQKTPIDLPPRKSITLELRVDTTARRGRNSFTIEAAGISPASGQPVLASAQLTAFIRYPLVATPAELLFPVASHSAEVSATIAIGDLMPDPGIAVSEVRSSHPDATSLTLAPASGPMMIPGVNGASKRYSLVVKIHPRDHAVGTFSRSTLVVVPADSRFQNLVIPVIWREPKRNLDLTPRSLTFTSQHGSEIWNREIAITVANAATASIAIDACPQNISASIITRSASVFSLKCEVRCPQPIVSRQQIVLSALPNGETVTIPITFLSPF